MKIIGCFLLMTFGFALQGFSQDSKNTDLKVNESQTHPDLIANLFENYRISITDTLKLEPGIISPNPPEFFLERKLGFTIPSTYRMPVYVLPDPQSRMPIKVFDDSVNYTILRKEYR